MTSPCPVSPSEWLRSIAPCSAATWQAASKRAFRGELSVETAHTLYRFKDGVFVSRLKRPHRSFDAPKAMRGLAILGFLADEGGLWSLSTGFTEGAHAVLWRPATEGGPASFTITSPCSSIAAEEPEPQPWVERERKPTSGVHQRTAAKPPTVRMLEPPSMTRIHASSG